MYSNESALCDASIATTRISLPYADAGSVTSPTPSLSSTFAISTDGTAMESTLFTVDMLAAAPNLPA